MRQRLWYLLVPTVACAAITAVVTAFYLPTRYQSDTLILVVPQRVPESYVRSTVTTRIEDRLQSITQQILSRTRLERIIKDFDLYPEQQKTGIMEDIVEGMRKDILLQVVKGDAFRVGYIGAEPRTVMRVTERLASLFIEENLRDREVLAEGTHQFLESQMEDMRARLIEKEGVLKRLRAYAPGEPGSEAFLIEYEVLKDTYKTLLVNNQQAMMAANLERQQIGEQFRILDPARMAEQPIAPSRGLVTLAGAGVGLGLGLVAIFVRHKKRSVQPGAVTVYPAQGRPWAAPHVVVFALLVVLLFVLVVVFGVGRGTPASAGADRPLDAVPPLDSSSGF